ncbi:hypothetical protein CJD36_017750 [Flavipsychrobacter stenotrophus]|uniref:Competence protein n=1 Tax=Flavipsychrobacter stenotrophus TaxID=2077091 RepID=A0A2S7SS78_9BACT|nr:hypothetical protein [Flavipsychrobacter stenotrophus]PQJ09772.1 hypothetical protein CJD36_017750 [Flavipsychrobacter stenotrophus]
MRSSPLKYAIYVPTNKPIFIDTARNGRECNCICAECGKVVDAIQGERNEKHFRHSVETDCKGGLETILHLRAKQIIVENNQIELPGVGLNYTGAISEEPFLKVIPDVTVIANGEKVFFEIALTNPKKKIEKEFYIANKLKSVEIHLEGLDYDIPQDELKRIVLINVNRKEIIFWTETSKGDGLLSMKISRYLVPIALLAIIYKLFQSWSRRR